MLPRHSPRSAGCHQLAAPRAGRAASVASMEKAHAHDGVQSSLLAKKRSILLRRPVDNRLVLCAPPSPPRAQPAPASQARGRNENFPARGRHHSASEPASPIRERQHQSHISAARPTVRPYGNEKDYHLCQAHLKPSVHKHARPLRSSGLKNLRSPPLPPKPSS